MDILSFILGISIVVVIAIAVVAVMGIVKVNKVKSQVDNIYHTISNEKEQQTREIQYIYRNIDERVLETNREFRTEIDNIYRSIDSRFDKLDNKINSINK